MWRAAHIVHAVHTAHTVQYLLYCAYCTYATYCTYCTCCTYCAYCTDCTYCTYCTFRTICTYCTAPYRLQPQLAIALLLVLLVFCVFYVFRFLGWFSQTLTELSRGVGLVPFVYRRIVDLFCKCFFCVVSIVCRSVDCLLIADCSRWVNYCHKDAQQRHMDADVSICTHDEHNRRHMDAQGCIQIHTDAYWTHIFLV